MIRRVIGVVGELIVTAGAVVLLFAVWQLYWTGFTADRASAASVDTITAAYDAGATGSSAPVKALNKKEGYALMYVARFGKDWVQPIAEGTDHQTLTSAVGHYTGTAEAGEPGNFAVAGHRTTYGGPFDKINLLKKGDYVVIETPETVYSYSVTGHSIVLPNDVSVLEPDPKFKAILTLTSCEPKFSATHRYIVHAKFVAQQPREDWIAAGRPTSTTTLFPTVEKKG